MVEEPRETFKDSEVGLEEEPVRNVREAEGLRVLMAPPLVTHGDSVNAIVEEAIIFSGLGVGFAPSLSYYLVSSYPQISQN